jgi:hypothetical protein
MLLNPLATYDSLFLADRLQRHLGAFAGAEIHLLAYLACLLSLYRETPLADWGYQFLSTELGAPYSREIDEAVHELARRGLLTRHDERMTISREAIHQLAELSELGLYKERLECLEAAADSIFAFSVGMVRSALSNDPELARSRDNPATRVLLESPGLDIIYEQFGIMAEVLGEERIDLRVPAVAWLTALFRHGQTSAIE